ncbi:MAG: aminoglycoside phosphotransferase family protein [Candidatus Dojkabacteria bacterium]|nr:aminoglycoside phosphotransferase family protein [Candidatus Dojkabacteria bacterium]
MDRNTIQEVLNKYGVRLQNFNGVSGGLLHNMYEIETLSNKFALKAFNPNILNTKDILLSYELSEEIAEKFFDNGINAVSAITSLDGSKIVKVNKLYFSLYNWVDGIVLTKPDQEKILLLLEELDKIHNTDVGHYPLSRYKIRDFKSFDWNELIERHSFSDEVDQKVKFLSKFITDYLFDIKESYQLLSSNLIISHRDLDMKNIIWDDNNPYIIGWESVGWINPVEELVSFALDWSMVDGEHDLEVIRLIVSKYKEGKSIKKKNLLHHLKQL